MRRSKKEAKFFCECCGAEVTRNSKSCPKCGKFFASVRCPQCGRIGSNEEFVNGCPSCGYAVSDPLKVKQNKNVFIPSNLKNSSGSVGRGHGIFGDSNRFLFDQKKSKNDRYVDSGLPIWVYIVSIVILAALVIVLYSCL